MTLDFLRNAVRDGPRAFPVGEYGTLAWFADAVLWWRPWAFGALVFPFTWALGPYLAGGPSSVHVYPLVRWYGGLVPWLVVRPLRLPAALPLVVWFLDSWRKPY